MKKYSKESLEIYFVVVTIIAMVAIIGLLFVIPAATYAVASSNWSKDVTDEVSVASIILLLVGFVSMEIRERIKTYFHKYY